MKPTKEIIGLRIISISDGTQVGVVKDFVLNPQEKTLDFLIIDQPTDYFGAKVIPFADVLGLGAFAITIPDPNVIQDVAQNIEAQNLLKQDTRVIGTKVLTKKGQLIGEVKEILIDEETGRIAACLFEAEGQMNEISAEKIITLGKELLIIEGDQMLQNRQIPDQNTENLSQTSSNSTAPTPRADDIQDTAGVDSAGEPEAGFNLFEQRQLQYFIGKKVEKNIVLDNGDILAAGETITPEMVTLITTRSTLMEVTSHLQKN
ncbi:PRC-barrel domain-containing protein [Desulfosporosinus sp. BICA1-9]|uniref:PRC-barrel domain-containing protein n=1 Tax=Desulfosporosinus sp. BICA1-9 TaxID=1531958 RepID=UPI00054C7F74|nr:PRC-barrel domain-containing protein [Desulfosporosinus sp. BICA1-9]KJS50411.1 MAG: photosystem reaction center subunit H [Peptococcaceae bacterium BRH_c23]KJS82243.1 MAG: photosystem reaction center subunit H [Desulfosporosinus sp. BICA1-9]KJS88983.1 MAG: photosystem reaction center subunit H [Desulfosporosinus sp. BICA1-9]HBW37975.1 photosystem reaction center subunit H [Desulfosporosinus sp.]